MTRSVAVVLALGVASACSTGGRGDEVIAKALIAAIEAHHAKEGRYPDSLTALVPNDLPPTLAEHAKEEIYTYRRVEEGGYRLTYMSSSGMVHVYESRTKTWETLFD
jgi:hypothetical protein